MFTITYAKSTVLAAILLTAPAQAATSVTYYGGESSLPITIGSTIISYVSPEDDGYYKFGITASQGGFGRYEAGPDMCYYWYHVSDAMATGGMSLDSPEIYDTTYCCAGPSEFESYLVDGATWGDDNYISYYDTDDRMVAVLRFAFTEGTSEITLLSVAYNSEGITFAEGILQAATVPEPSSLFLLGLGSASALLVRRRI